MAVDMFIKTTQWMARHKIRNTKRRSMSLRSRATSHAGSAHVREEVGAAEVNVQDLTFYEMGR